MGTEWMSSKLAVTLSPGITISTPSGSSTLPARQAWRARQQQGKAPPHSLQCCLPTSCSRCGAAAHVRPASHAKLPTVSAAMDKRGLTVWRAGNIRSDVWKAVANELSYLRHRGARRAPVMSAVRK